jgi:hypothetical protein
MLPRNTSDSTDAFAGSLNDKPTTRAHASTARAATVRTSERNCY